MHVIGVLRDRFTYTKHRFVHGWVRIIVQAGGSFETLGFKLPRSGIRLSPVNLRGIFMRAFQDSFKRS